MVKKKTAFKPANSAIWAGVGAVVTVIIVSLAKIGGEVVPASMFAYAASGAFWGFIAAELRNGLSLVLYRASLRRQIGNSSDHRR